MRALKKWRAYWQDQTLPLHRYDTEEHYRRYGAELRLLFQETAPQHVLEIGCGNGALYRHLGFENAQYYKGVDFSASMLEEFRKKHPGIELECRDGSAYEDQHTYDLIFSNGVIQYFDRDMLAQHFGHVRAMMKPESLFVCASVPWRSQRFKYMSGELGAAHRRNLLRGVGGALISPLRGNMGFWYGLRDIERVADRNGMAAEFYGSMHYSYRFHAVMRLR